MELTALVPNLKRAVAAPGEFDTYFPNTGESDLAGALADALAEVQLDGLLSTSEIDVDSLTVTPDLTSPQQALVVLYAMGRILSARIANLKNRTKYQAGSASAETEQSASVLVELLREATARRNKILDDLRYGGIASTDFTMVDLYIAKSVDVFNRDALALNYLEYDYRNPLG